MPMRSSSRATRHRLPNMAAVALASEGLPEEQRATMPVPPSVNKHLRIGQDDGGRPRLYTTKEQRLYRAQARLTLARLRPYPADVPVTVEFLWWQASDRQGDLDNRIKAALDAMKGYAYVDDRQVRRIVMDCERTRSVAGYMDVLVRRRRSWYRTGEE